MNDGNGDGDSLAMSLKEYPPSWIAIRIIQTILHFFTVIVCVIFLAAVAQQKKLRCNGYNLYLVFLVIPDGLNNIIMVVYNVYLLKYNGTHPSAVYFSLIWIYLFCFCSNFYLNAVVAFEVKKLVDSSYARRRTSPPSPKRVLIQVSGVYLSAILIATWFTIQVPWSPLHVDDARRGISSLKLLGTSLAYLLVLIPTVYVIYVRFRIWWLKLLPKRGQTRVISLFLLRILVVYFVFYFPNLIISTIRASVVKHDSVTHISQKQLFWLTVGLNFFNCSQALTTLFMASMKDDIYEAIKDLLMPIKVKITSLRKRIVESNSNFNNTEVVNKPEVTIPPETREHARSSIWEEDDVYEQEAF